MSASSKPVAPPRLARRAACLAGAVLAGWTSPALAADDFYWGAPSASGFTSTASDFLPDHVRARTYTFTHTESASVTRSTFQGDAASYSPVDGRPAQMSLDLPLAGPAGGIATVTVTGYLDAVFHGSSTGTGAQYATTIGGIKSGGVETRLPPGFESFFDKDAQDAYVEPKSPFADTAENYSSNGNPASMHHRLVSQTFQVRPGANTVDLTADLQALAFARGSSTSVQNTTSDVTSTMTFTVSVVPEPAQYALLLAGLPLLALGRRRTASGVRSC
jgi:hypothetical protein